MLPVYGSSVGSSFHTSPLTLSLPELHPKSIRPHEGLPRTPILSQGNSTTNTHRFSLGSKVTPASKPATTRAPATTPNFIPAHHPAPYEVRMVICRCFVAGAPGRLGEGRWRGVGTVAGGGAGGAATKHAAECGANEVLKVRVQTARAPTRMRTAYIIENTENPIGQTPTNIPNCGLLTTRLRPQRISQTVGCLRHCSLEASISVILLQIFRSKISQTVGTKSFFPLLAKTYLQTLWRRSATAMHRST